MSERPPVHSPSRLRVTGRAGFKDANFVHHWLRGYPGHRVVVLDALTYVGVPKIVGYSITGGL